MPTVELSRYRVRHLPPKRAVRESAGLRRQPGFRGAAEVQEHPRKRKGSPGCVCIILTRLDRVLVDPGIASCTHTGAFLVDPGLESAMHSPVEGPEAPRENRRQFS